MIAITGRGCITTHGRGLTIQHAALQQGSCGLRRQTDASLPLAHHLAVGRIRESISNCHGHGRSLALALLAAEDALQEAGLSQQHRRDIPVLLGSSTAGMSETEPAFFAGRATDPVWQEHAAGTVARRLAESVGLGPAVCHSVACASAACALVDAACRIQSGEYERVLVVGTDALCRTTMAGFHALQVCDPAGCRPFCRERAGMSLGEGAAALLLEAPASARRRGHRASCTLSGWSIRADAHHVTAPRPDGCILRKAIAESLAMADLTAGDIDWINAHGTGTRDNDAVECHVLNQVFGSETMVSSSKRVFGHCLGAAAAIEAVACSLAIESRYRYVSAGAEQGTPLDGIRVLQTSESGRVRHALSTTLAFGGVNVALLFSEPEA